MHCTVQFVNFVHLWLFSEYLNIFYRLISNAVWNFIIATSFICMTVMQDSTTDKVCNICHRRGGNARRWISCNECDYHYHASCCIVSTLQNLISARMVRNGCAKTASPHAQCAPPTLTMVNEDWNVTHVALGLTTCVLMSTMTLMSFLLIRHSAGFALIAQ